MEFAFADGGMVEGELVGTDPAQVTLLPRVRVTVFNDADGAALRTLQTVHGSLNTRQAQESTTVRLALLSSPEGRA